MAIRVAVATLWFLSGWFAFGLVAYFAAMPSSFGAVVGALAASLVLLDPAERFWPASDGQDTGWSESAGSQSRDLLATDRSR